MDVGVSVWRCATLLKTNHNDWLVLPVDGGVPPLYNRVILILIGGETRMKLKPKARADRPNPTAYTLAIGSAEAREAGLIGNKGELYEVEKTVKAGVLVVSRKGREEAAGNERRTT